VERLCCATAGLLAVVAVGCSSGAGGGGSGSGGSERGGSHGATGATGAKGAASGTGGSTGAGGTTGATASGGAPGRGGNGAGGNIGTGGLPGSGGLNASGGGRGNVSGGASGSGGTRGAGGASGAGGSPGSGAATGTGGATGSGGSGNSPEAKLATTLGKPARFLVGLGSSEQSDISGQGITPDFFERYLVGSGQNLESGWQTWNSPEGAYVNAIAGMADAVGAVPMFTVYMSTARGEGNLAYLGDSAFMMQYWHLAKLVFQRLAIYGKPALVSVEPDFWGFVESQATGRDPTKVTVQVKVESDCAAYANDLTGLAACYIHLARTYAPKARIGFPPSSWGAPTIADDIAFMNKVGVGAGDFTVVQTTDRDVGCYEGGNDSACTRALSYLDESNATSPNYTEYLATMKQYRDGIGTPLIWWQTPLGAPSSTPGGTPNHYRDNHVHYFLTHTSELVAIGGVGAVFGAGWSTQTSITTDNGQFKTLSTAYFAKPALLP